MSGADERRLDPAVVMVQHEPGRRHWCNGWVERTRTPCLPYRMAEAWSQEFTEHTELLEKYNQQERAYAELEQAFMAVSDAYGDLVDRLSA